MALETLGQRDKLANREEALQRTISALEMFVGNEGDFNSMYSVLIAVMSAFIVPVRRFDGLPESAVEQNVSVMSALSDLMNVVICGREGVREDVEKQKSLVVALEGIMERDKIFLEKGLLIVFPQNEVDMDDESRLPLVVQYDENRRMLKAAQHRVIMNCDKSEASYQCVMAQSYEEGSFRPDKRVISLGSEIVVEGMI